MNFIKALLRKKRTNESYLRYTFGLLHLWLGLITGLGTVIICLTGALYVFADEYDHIENRKHLKADAPSDNFPSLDKMVSDFEQKFGNAPGGIFVPLAKDEHLSIADRGFGDTRQKAYVDRETGNFVATATNKSKAFTFTIIKLHRWFMFKDMDKGRKVVGYTTFAFIFLLLSGIVVWWPRNLKALKNSLKVKLKGSFKVVNRQLHVNLGFYLTLLLIVIALTGTCITFPTVRQQVIKTFVQEDASPKEKTLTKEQHKAIRSKHMSGTISFDKMLEISSDVLGYESDVNIYFPSHHFKEYSVLAVNPNNFLGGQWPDVVTFDLNGNYKTTYFFADFPLWQQLNQLLKPIHTGEVFGSKSKILVLLLALFGAFLPISGIIIWWKRIARKA